MGFLSGSITYECFRVENTEAFQFGPEHIKTLTKHAISEKENRSLEHAQVGFLGGDHLFDREFDLEKNIIADALQFAVRIDANQIPGTIRRAWLQIELAAFRAEAPERRPTKAERQEAKDAVDARCEDAARSGQYLKMSQFPVLWDARDSLFFVGTSSPSAIEACQGLMEKAFSVELSHLSSGRLASEWAGAARRRGQLNQVHPSSFQGGDTAPMVQWWNGQADNYDYLGNEFLLWLWWCWETESDTIALPDDSEVVGMFSRTLSVQCPLGESGKGSISSEIPTALPEASQAIGSGKLPRKAGLTLVRHDQQYDLTLQAESFSVGGGKIHVEESSDERGRLEDRVEGLREFNETLVLLYQTFCDERINEEWPKTLNQIRKWLKAKR